MTELQGDRRLPRAQRRVQILAAATRTFARAGYAATSLDDVAREAGISRMIVYRHFDSKRELYLSALHHIGERLGEVTAAPQFSEDSLAALVATAADEPDGFRLLFQHAAREPEFRAEVDQLRASMSEVTRDRMAAQIDDPAWAAWASAFVPVATIEAVLSWLDAGQPDPDGVVERIRTVIHGVIAAAQQGRPWHDCPESRT